MPTKRPIPKELNPLIAVQPLLEVLPASACDQLISESTMISFEPGEMLIRENEENLLLYFILKGEATVEMNGTAVADLEAGDVAGEISISGISPPVATVIARTAVEVIGFPAASITRTISAHPEFGQRLKNAAFQRISG